MFREYIGRAQAWFGRAVRNSAVNQFSKSVHGGHLRRGLPIVASFIVGAAVLIGQLTLSTAGFPESFAGFLLASPLLSVFILACLAMAVYPDCASQAPLYGIFAVLALGALQALLGALVSIAPAPPNRIQFALLTAGIVCVGVMMLSKKLVENAMQTVNATGDRVRVRFQNAVETVPEVAEEEDEDDDSGGE